MAPWLFRSGARAYAKKVTRNHKPIGSIMQRQYDYTLFPLPSCSTDGVHFFCSCSTHYGSRTGLLAPVLLETSEDPGGLGCSHAASTGWKTSGTGTLQSAGLRGRSLPIQRQRIHIFGMNSSCSLVSSPMGRSTTITAASSLLRVAHHHTP